MPLQVHDLVNKYNVRLFKSLTSIEEVMAQDYRTTIKRMNKIFDRVTKSLQWEAVATLGIAGITAGLGIGVGRIPNVAPAKQPMEIISKILPKASEFYLGYAVKPETERLRNIGQTEQSIIAQQHKDERQKLEHARQSMEDKIAKLQELEHASYRRT